MINIYQVSLERQKHRQLYRSGIMLNIFCIYFFNLTLLILWLEHLPILVTIDIQNHYNSYIVLHHVNILAFQSLHWWKFRLFPIFYYDKQCCNENNLDVCLYRHIYLFRINSCSVIKESKRSHILILKTLPIS